MKREPVPDRFTLRRFLVKVLMAATGMTRQRPLPKPPFAQVVILAQEKLGDAILMTPLPRLIKAAYPSTIIHVVTSGKNKSFYEADPAIDRVYALKPVRLPILREIRRQHYDLLINTKDHPSFSFLLLVRYLRAETTIGIDHPYHRGFFHHLVEIGFYSHMIEKYCALLAALSVPADPAAARPALPPVAASATVREFAARLDTVASPRIGINLSAGEKDREWPLEKWRSLLLRFPRAHFFVFAMPDKKTGRISLETSFHGCEPMPATGTIYDVGEIAGRLDLMITPDTSLVHVCSCRGIPVVGLYRCGKNHITHFGPYRIPHRLVVAPGMEVADISVDRVAEAVNDLCDTLVMPRRRAS